MKNIKKNFRTFLYVAFSILLFSCKKDEPSVKDHFLNYKIPEVAVTKDYNVGAFYSVATSFIAAIKEVPVLGKYVASTTTGVPAAIMDKHLEYAQKAGIDYFVFGLRSFNTSLANYKTDTVMIRSFLNSNIDGKVKFAINYNFSTYSLTNLAPLENNATKLAQFYNDFERMESIFKNPNYMKVDGKVLVYIAESRNLYSNDNKAIYKEIRRRMLALGIEMYIVGYQEAWSPPARYAPYRFVDCVDAVYHQSLLPSRAANSYQWDFSYYIGQAIDQNYKYNREYLAEHYSLDFIPNIYPGNDLKISTPTTNNPSISRENGENYKMLCNVAKMNANSKTRLILVDSFNDWASGTQIEPAESYGDLYLNITRQQFKK